MKDPMNDDDYTGNDEQITDLKERVESGQLLCDAFRAFLKNDMDGLTAEEIHAIEYGSYYGQAIEAIAAYEGKTMAESVNELAEEQE